MLKLIVNNNLGPCLLAVPTERASEKENHGKEEERAQQAHQDA